MNFSLFFIRALFGLLNRWLEKLKLSSGLVSQRNKQRKYKNKLCSKVYFVIMLLGPFLWLLLFFLLPKDLLLAFSS